MFIAQMFSVQLKWLCPDNMLTICHTSLGISLFYFSLQNHAESHHRTNQAMTEGKVSCLSKQLESLMGFEPTTDRHQQITDSLTMVPNHHSLSLY